MTANLFSKALGALVALVLSTIIYRIHFHPLRRVPGPFWARTTELWRTSRYFAGTWHEDIRRLHRQYGPVVRVAPNEVSIVDPELPNTIYSITKGTEKTSAYDTWTALGGYRLFLWLFPNFGVFGERRKDWHRGLRSRISNIYSMSSVLTYEKKLTPVYEGLFENLDAHAKSGTSFDLAAWANFFTYDIVTLIGISRDLGFVRAGSDHNGFIEGVHVAFYWISCLANVWGQSDWYQNPIVKYVSSWFGSGALAGSLDCLQKLNVWDEIQRRQERGPNPSGKQDFLDSFMTMKSVTGKPLSIVELYVEVGNPLLAGADTSAVAIAAVLGPLMLDRKRLERLRAEVDQRATAIKADRRVATPLVYDDVKDLPYLKACITEGMRIHPSIVFQLQRKAPKTGIILSGQLIPDGCVVSMSPAAQNRSKAIFGDDADEWKPERWLDVEPTALAAMEKGLATFGYGTRSCLGRNLATMSLLKLISTLVFRYDLQLVGPMGKPWTTKAQWFSKIENMMVRLEMRETPSINLLDQTHSCL